MAANRLTFSAALSQMRTTASSQNRPLPLKFATVDKVGTHTVPICAMGGVGVISVAANIIPAQMHELVHLCFANDFAAAGNLQLKLKPLFDTLFCEVNPIPVKTALNLMGMGGGDLRLPLCPPSEANLERIRSTLAQYGLLPT